MTGALHAYDEVAAKIAGKGRVARVVVRVGRMRGCEGMWGM